MSSQIFLFQLLLIFALICSGQMAFALYTRRSASGALYLSLFMGAAFLWSLGALMGLTAPTIRLDFFWLAFSFLGVTATSVLFLAFALDYSHNTRWLRWKYFIPISILPLTIQILAWIPETRHLLWVVVETGGNIQKFVYSYGWVFWIFYSYSYLLIGIALYFLFIRPSPTLQRTRKQNRLLLMACIITIAFNLLSAFQGGTSFITDLTPLGFICAIIIIYLGIYRYNIFNIITFAQSEVIDNLSDAVVVIDEVNRIIFRNQAFLYYFAGSSKFVIGQDIRQVIPKLDLEKLIETEENFQTFEFTYENQRYEIRISLIHANDQESSGKAIVFHDITQRKLKEIKLHLLAHDLQSKLAENVALISDLKSFSYKVAHDLKSPLNAIIGFGELIEEEAENDSLILQHIKTVNRTSDKMLNIINELLIFSNITTREVVREPIDMKAAVDAAVERCSSLVQETGAQISVSDVWPQAEGYGFWIEEVWVNLISNAIKYGGRPPVISIGWQTDENGTTWFTIADNGIGIGPEQMDSLFKPYSKHATSEYESHGIGLSIVDRMIRKLEGRIMVKSTGIPGEGSVFLFSLFSQG